MFYEHGSKSSTQKEEARLEKIKGKWCFWNSKKAVLSDNFAAKKRENYGKKEEENEGGKWAISAF